MIKFEKQIDELSEFLIHPNNYVVVYDENPNYDITISNLNSQILSLTNELEEKEQCVVETQTVVKNTLNQFKTGDIELTYTRLNGKVETFMIDRNEQLSKNFKVSEFLCPNCNKLILSEVLVSIAQNIRDYFGKPMNISSGYRTQTYNDSLPGSIKTSLHIQGKAIDFDVIDVSVAKTLTYAKTIPNVIYSYTNNANMDGYVHINI